MPNKQINVVVLLEEARHELKGSYPKHQSAIDGVIIAVKGLLTESDKTIMLPTKAKDKIKKLIGLTIEEPESYPGFWSRLFPKKAMPIAETRRRLALLSTYIVNFIHGYK